MRNHAQVESTNRAGLYQRLQKAKKAIKREAFPTTRNKREVLKSRARELSRPEEKAR